MLKYSAMLELVGLKLATKLELVKLKLAVIDSEQLLLVMDFSLVEQMEHQVIRLELDSIEVQEIILELELVKN